MRNLDRGAIQSIVSSTWFLGVLVSVASWKVAFTAPLPSLDPSWMIGLYMAAQEGLRFGQEVVFTYGPLSFLRFPLVVSNGLATVAFLYGAAKHVALSISLVWALRRTLHPLATVVVAYFALTFFDIDPGLELAAIWCLAALAPDSPRLAGNLVAFPGAVIAAIETLGKLSYGPVVAAVCLLTLVALERRRRLLPAFAGIYVLSLSLLWLVSGQGAGNVDDFVRETVQITTGYVQAAPFEQPGLGWQLPVAIPVAIAVLACVGASLRGAARPSFWAGLGVAGLLLFLGYKEGFVQHDVFHAYLFFSIAFGIVVAVPWRSAGTVLPAVSIAAVGLVAVPSNPLVRADFDQTMRVLNPVEHVRAFGPQLRSLVSPGRLDELRAESRAYMRDFYRLDRRSLEMLRGHTVHVDPWEIGAAWAYRLKWHPLPVFQDYQVLTSQLDGLNEDALASASGPSRILRENTGAVDPDYPIASIAGRYPAYDPPGAAIAMLCNFAPLRTTERWEVLGRVRDRCGQPQLIGSIDTQYGERLPVPPAPAPLQVVYARVEGAGVSGLERLRTLVYRAKERFVELDGGRSYRLVPGTAQDGLLLNAPRAVDFPEPFRLAPGARSIAFAIAGDGSGALHVDFFAMRVRPVPDGKR